MKLITCYSDSHKILFDKYFLPSLKQYLNVDLKIKILNQTSKTGYYNSDGFNKTVQEKIQWIIENIELNNEVACFSDVDVQFFKELKYDMKDNDILFQWDYYDYCSGFFIFKQNLTVLNFLKEVERLTPNVLEDQVAVNQLLKTYHIKYDKLDNRYWNIGSFCYNLKINWTGEDFVCPKYIIMHHANFTVGIPNKIKLLESVKQKINSKTKTLICIFGQTRAWELTYNSFIKYLYRDNMDVCLSIGVDEKYNYQNPFCTLAKYKFFYKEPEDYATAFDYAMKTKGFNSNWRILLKIKQDWLGGIVDDKYQHPGSAAIGFFYRWWLVHNLKINDLIKEYDWFIVTRSDHFYEFDHPLIETLDPEKIYVPEGEDYKGIVDRHMIVHRNFFEKAIELLNPIISDPEKLYQEMREKILNKKVGYGCYNSERYLDFVLKKRSLIDKIIKFPRPMYLVRGEKDSTRWSKGKYNEEVKMIVKYDSEYQMVKNNKNTLLKT